MTTITIYGKTAGYRSCAVSVSPDGTMYRADVPLELATRIRTIAEAAGAVGMTRKEFIDTRNCLRDGSCVQPRDFARYMPVAGGGKRKKRAST